MQIVEEDEVEERSFCSLPVCRWMTASVGGLEAAETIAGQGLIAWRAKTGGLAHLRTITVSPSYLKYPLMHNLPGVLICGGRARAGT